MNIIPFAGTIESLQNRGGLSRLARQSFGRVPGVGKVLEPQRRAQTWDVMPKAKKRWMAGRHAIGHWRQSAKSRPSRRMRSHNRSAKHSGTDDRRRVWKDVRHTRRVVRKPRCVAIAPI